MPRQQPIHDQRQKPTLRPEAGFHTGPPLFSHILLHPSPSLYPGVRKEQVASLQEVGNHHKKRWFGKDNKCVESTEAEEGRSVI